MSDSGLSHAPAPTGLGSMIADLAPHDKPDMDGQRLPEALVAPTRFLRSIWAFISNADEFTARGGPGQMPEECPPSVCSGEKWRT
jgi:hypothetical protein